MKFKQAAIQKDKILKLRMMLITLLAMSVNTIAQPTTINWQGKLLDASGNANIQKSLCYSEAFLWHTDNAELMDSHSFFYLCKSVLSVSSVFYSKKGLEL